MHRRHRCSTLEHLHVAQGPGRRMLRSCCELLKLLFLLKVLKNGELVATLTYNSSATGADWANTKWEATPGGANTPDASGTFELTSGFGNLSP